MSEQVNLDEIANAVLTSDADKVYEATNNALNAGVDPLKIIEEGLTKGLRIVGQKFEEGELFLLDLVAAAEVAKKTLSEILEPRILELKAQRKSLGKVVIGTVSGDIHDIGKNIVAAMIFAGGFEVHDLGKDIPAIQFVTKSKELAANVVASSALLSTTMPVQRDIVEALRADNMRNTVKVMVGGAPVTAAWAKEIGADGYAESAAEAVELTRKLLNTNRVSLQETAGRSFLDRPRIRIKYLQLQHHDR